MTSYHLTVTAVIDDPDSPPGTSEKLQALIAYLGEGSALDILEEALQGHPQQVSDTVDAQPGVIRTANGDEINLNDRAKPSSYYDDGPGGPGYRDGWDGLTPADTGENYMEAFRRGARNRAKYTAGAFAPDDTRLS